MKAILKRTRQDLPVKVNRYELALEIIILLISGHISPLATKRSLNVLPSSIWQFYHALRTFSTASIINKRSSDLLKSTLLCLTGYHLLPVLSIKYP